MLSALTPKRINRGLDLNNISVGDGSFSDGNGQHTHCITEKAQGRQPKIKKVNKIWVGCNLTVKLVKIWVETIKCGLKIGEFSACWTY
jgi:hypothetical protein